MKKLYLIPVITIAFLLGSISRVGEVTVRADSSPVNDYTDSKDLGSSLPDPNRNYYDAQGNEYNYQGVLIQPAATPTAPKTSCSN